jgi:hypothetical protein
MSVSTKQASETEVLMSINCSSPARFQPVELGKIDGTRAVLEAVPESMSAHAGAMMIAQVERKVGLLAALAKVINDPRDQNLIDHEASDILMQRACQIAAGHIDGNDADWLRGDPSIVASLDRHPVDGRHGASQETISRFESNAVTEKNFESVDMLLADHYIKHHPKRPRRIKIDADGMNIETFGSQEGATYRGGKYQREMYFPLMMFITNWCVAVTLRSGDQGESSTILASLKKIVARLREKWQNVPITVRMDAAFGSPELYSWCRKNHVDFELGLRPNKVLALQAQPFIEQAEKQFRKQFGEPKFIGKDGGKKAYAEHRRVRKLPDKNDRMSQEKQNTHRRVRVFGEFNYKADSWDQPECVIVRADYTDKGLDIRYVMVSKKFGTPEKIYEDDYCQRGLMEQFNGRFKQTGQRLSTQTFYANQFRMTMYGITYQLLLHLQEYVGSKLKRSDVNTIRKTLMLMPMVVRCTEKKIVFQISERHPHSKEFIATWRRLSAA